MADGTELLQAIKQAATDANEAGQPCDYVYGTVESESPLTINVEQKMTLGEAQLAICRNVTDFDIEITLHDWSSETESGGSGEASFASHSHRLSGKKKVTIHNALKAGEKVALLKQKGGQQYLVVDRVKQ